ncbi:unnamed protein product, partial [Mesorhabditis belari]|uniref:Uncharacterized protein n=1 Tax=Mesorhabditis belari TaxID=2138241 RepID=A0AAF3FEE7_9BILA
MCNFSRSTKKVASASVNAKLSLQPEVVQWQAFDCDCAEKLSQSSTSEPKSIDAKLYPNFECLVHFFAGNLGGIV